MYEIYKYCDIYFIQAFIVIKINGRDAIKFQKFTTFRKECVVNNVVIDPNCTEKLSRMTSTKTSKIFPLKNQNK